MEQTAHNNGSAIEMSHRSAAMLVNNPATHDARIFRVATSLRKSGYDVTIIGTYQAGLAADEIANGFHIIRVGQARSLRRLMGRRQSASDSVASVHHGNGMSERNARLTIGRHWRYLTFLAWFIFIDVEMYRVLRRLQPDMCHANDLDTLLAGYWFTRKSGAKLVYDAHELFTEQDQGIPSWWKRALSYIERRGIRRAHAVITVNGSIRDELVRRYHRPDIAVVRNAQPQGMVVSPSPVHEPIRLLFHGVVGPDRGVEEIFEAMRLVPNVHLTIRGSGALAHFHRIAERMGLSDRVQFVPAVPMQEVIRAASESDIGLIPYQPTCLNNYFSLPNKLFEYLAAGLAIAASDLPEIRAVINEHHVGVVFDSSSPTAIAKSLTILVQNPSGLGAMKERAHDLANRLTWEHEEATVLGLYRSLVF